MSGTGGERREGGCSRRKRKIMEGKKESRSTKKKRIDLGGRDSNFQKVKRKEGKTVFVCTRGEALKAKYVSKV